ncbi:hypothetical protein E1A90_05240 [Bacillus mycoides]|nr:hypothetical protein E1A90_05240 [Bacillus mycoides]
MKNRQKASIICKSILCLMICIFITNEVWFTNVVRAESGTLNDRSIEDFKKSWMNRSQNGRRIMRYQGLQ